MGRKSSLRRVEIRQKNKKKTNKAQSLSREESRDSAAVERPCRAEEGSGGRAERLVESTAELQGLTT